MFLILCLEESKPPLYSPPNFDDFIQHWMKNLSLVVHHSVFEHLVLWKSTVFIVELQIVQCIKNIVYK